MIGDSWKHLLELSTCLRSDRPTSLQEILTLFIRDTYAGMIIRRACDEVAVWGAEWAGNVC